MKHYLATTAISEIWDYENDLLLLGPWCLIGKNNKQIKKDYSLIPSPWKPTIKIKEAADYCHKVYEEWLTKLCEALNSIHQVSYPVRYWRILIGPWLLHFIGVVYDRYKRIEKAIELFPGFYTQILLSEQCKLESFDTYDFFNRVNEDYYNLELFSLIAYELCPHNIVEKRYKYESKIQISFSNYSWKRKLFNKLIEQLDLFLKSPIVLTDMYHLTDIDKFLLRWKAGFKTVRFIDFEQRKEKLSRDKYSYEFRKEMKIEGACDRFQCLLYKLLPNAMPMCYMENYKPYIDSISHIKNNIDAIRIIGSAVGWFFNERFKFFAAEAVSKGAKLIDFQHGGGYGISLAVPVETISIEKDIFYTWGWNSENDKKIKPLPSVHLSKLKNTFSLKFNNILFVGLNMPRYHYRFHTHVLPEDMLKYFEDKKIFFQALPEEIKNKVLYRPYWHDYGWGELEMVKKLCPNAKFVLNGRLVSWMQKVKLVVIDHPHTSYLEALTINVPCILFWDHRVYLMRPQAEEYFKLLRDAEILFKDPISAAKKVKEIFNDPLSWWLQDDVQKARLDFCKHYAYARKDWIKVWTEELKSLKTEVSCQASR